MSRRIVLFIIALFTMSLAHAQEDPVLMTVGNVPVKVSEFKYIYTKTNGAKADFSEKSLREYLNLYGAFKMKVQRAKDLQLDTIQALKSELDGYRRQLSKNYLTDREIMNTLVKEAYDRMQTDVSISHILVKVSPEATPADTLAAYKKALNILNEIKSGKRFAQVAKERSEDGSTKEDGGKIGFITALQLTGFYNIETAAYTTPVGEVAGPVRTRLGYHLVRVDETRPARGEIEAAHIVIRVNDKAQDEADAQSKINNLYRELQGGANFEILARQHSQDEKTLAKGGYIGTFGIGIYEAAFEEAAFSITKDGGFSRPFRSSIGWHIIKRISLKGVPPFDEIKGQLINKVRRDSRFELVQTRLIENIKKENNFQLVTKVKEDFMNSLDPSFITYQWVLPQMNFNQPLFSLGGKTFQLADFVDYLKRAAGGRVRQGRTNSPEVVATDLLNDYLRNTILDYEEGRLESKYPEFANLMREYQEGILLFEVTKREVWDKASQDSIGLSGFYERNKEKYKWGERVKATIYTLNTESEKIKSKFLKYAKKRNADKVVSKINKRGEFISVEQGIFERGKNNMVDATVWKAGMLGQEWNENDKKMYVKIEEVIPPQVKALADAKGYVIADYQDYLEKEWIKTLKNTYPMKIKEDVLKTIIK